MKGGREERQAKAVAESGVGKDMSESGGNRKSNKETYNNNIGRSKETYVMSV